MSEIEHVKCSTSDLAEETARKLLSLLPECAGEAGEIDLDKLRQCLSSKVVEGNVERYEFTWPGKRAAKAAASASTTKTLRPCREESVDFDITGNLYIEGDNLEVLKLLQTSYAGRVKMIYIDPPYNTGHDFVYRDRFSLTQRELDSEAGSFDDDGNRFEVNDSASARYHSNWCSMMYPRLKLARNLLRDDGVIFISIDDNEVTNLRKLCDEIYGESNFVAQFVWEGAYQNAAKIIGTNHEYVLVYSKVQLDGANPWTVRKDDADLVLAEVKRLQAKYGDDYASASRDMAGWFRANKAKPVFAHRRFHLIDKNGAYKEDDPTAPGGRHFDLINPNTGNVIPLRNNRGWRFDQPTFNAWVEKGKISFVTQNSIMVRTYFHETDSSIPQSVFYQAARSASERLSKLMGDNIFPYPKDENVIARFVEMATSRESIVLDFFSGSATTAHAVMRLNEEDGGKRRFIMVQLPEPCAEDSEAARAGYANICEIGKERIRRAGKKIVEEWIAKNSENDDNQRTLELGDSDTSVNPAGDTPPDIGFRVLKLDQSSLIDADVTMSEAAQDRLALSRIREDRSPEDLLFQMLLETRIPLSDFIVTAKICGNDVFFVGGEGKGAPLVACLDPKAKMDTTFFLEIAKLKPGLAFFRDDAFADDSARTNLQQAFDQFSPTTAIKVI